jgi:hypothetical protein
VGAGGCSSKAWSLYTRKYSPKVKGAVDADERVEPAASPGRMPGLLIHSTMDGYPVRQGSDMGARIIFLS